MPQTTRTPLELNNTYFDGHVVIINNYLRAHHVKVYEALARRVKQLTVLLSTPMEPNRSWLPEWGDLTVVLQKNLTIHQWWRHSTGFKELTYVHFPIDTVSQLKRLQPDIVFSAELGLRTLLSGYFGWRNRRIPIVAVGNMSDWIERERGWARRMTRQLLRRLVKYCTYNGPSCLKYLRSIGYRDEQLFFVPYFFDEGKVDLRPRPQRSDDIRRLVISGRLTLAKGIRLLTEQLQRWCQNNPQRVVELIVCGEGPDRGEFDRLHGNCRVDHRGHCSDEQLRNAYHDADLMIFPSLADEWGLAPIEAWKSGLPVVGSLYAQSVETLGREGENGWFCFPDRGPDLYAALDRALKSTASELQQMEERCRSTVSSISADRSAAHFGDIIQTVLPQSVRTLTSSKPTI